MNLKEFLSATKIIKESTLAALMWPDKKHSAKVFSNKINEIKAGSGKQRITEDDETRAKVVLNDIANQIKAYTGDIQAKPESTPAPVQPSPPIKDKVVKTVVEKEPTMAELARQLKL